MDSDLQYFRLCSFLCGAFERNKERFDDGSNDGGAEDKHAAAAATDDSSSSSPQEQNDPRSSSKRVSNRKTKKGSTHDNNNYYNYNHNGINDRSIIRTTTGVAMLICFLKICFITESKRSEHAITQARRKCADAFLRRGLSSHRTVGEFFLLSHFFSIAVDAGDDKKQLSHVFVNTPWLPVLARSFHHPHQHLLLTPH
jgi:hypothetical protein